MIYEIIEPGDIFWCVIETYNKKEDRPCIVLKKLPNNKIEVLPITSIKSKNNLIYVNMSFIECCSRIIGYINKTIEVADLDHCYVGNVCNCRINTNLKILLTLKGIKFN